MNPRTASESEPQTSVVPNIAASLDEEDSEFARVDAEAAYRGVSALVEILSGCQPGYQVTGIFIHSLLVDVRMHLENVVGSLRVGTVENTFQSRELQ
jgi:hypothetical protein